MEDTGLNSQSSSQPSINTESLMNASNNTPEVNDVPRSSDCIDLTVNVGSKRKTSEIWDAGNFEKVIRLDGIRDPNKCFCVACKEVLPCANRKNGTSSAWAHAKKCKLNPLYAKCEKLYMKVDKSQSTLNKDNISGSMVHHQFSKKKSDEKCVEMIVRDELAFRFVEGAGFRAFCNEMQPRYKIPGRKTIAKLVLEKYATEKAKLISQLAKNKTRVSITTDTWTSIQNINYIVVTAHFIDSEWKLHKRITNFCVITSHKGEDIGKVLELCLREWEITRLFSITVDNASANSGVVDHMKKRLRSYKTLLFDGEYLHLRCACHIINLTLKDGLKELESSIEAIWNCVKYIRSSSSRLKMFREFAVLEHMRENANVPLDVATRWNSTYFMLEAALKYESVFARMVDEDTSFQDYFNEIDKNKKIRVGPPEEGDWRKAAAFVVFLKRFYQATVKLSAWKSVTINLVFPEMIGLQLEMDKRMLSKDSVMGKVAASMKTKFDKYWGTFEKVNKIIFVANVLDPRYKIQYYTKANSKMGTLDTIVEEKTKALKSVLVKLYEKYKGTGAGSTRMTSETQERRGRFNIVDVDVDEVLADCLHERLDEQSEGMSNEVDQYLLDKFSTFTPDFDLCDWWKNKETVYPVLSSLAKDIFAIPCSTVASENAFSLSSRIVDPFRSSLTPRMVEALVCCSDWLRGEEVNFYKDPTEDELDFYASLEEAEQDK